MEAHEVLEESILYPQKDKYPETAELVGLAFEEHAEVDTVLQEISKLSAGKPEWLERIAELEDLVEQHI